MRWNAATGAIARCKATSIAYARKGRSVPAWRWTCGVKPTPKAVNKPSPHFIVHGLDKPGGFTTVSFLSLIFFESGKDAPSPGQRQYHTHFAQSTTRRIYYEVHMGGGERGLRI